MRSNTPFVITIDGTAGSGKTTLGRALAERLGFRFVGSGLLYRAVTLAVIESEILPSDGAAIEAALKNLDLSVSFDGSKMMLYLSERSLTHSLQEESINLHVAKVAAHPTVRCTVDTILRNVADGFGCVVEGRDIGSVVFPNAPLKIYLDAQLGVREARRAADGAVDYIASRDTLDRNRAMAPLTIPQNSVVIDSGVHDAESVLRLACEALHRRGFPMQRRP